MSDAKSAWTRVMVEAVENIRLRPIACQSVFGETPMNTQGDVTEVDMTSCRFRERIYFEVCRTL